MRRSFRIFPENADEVNHMYYLAQSFNVSGFDVVSGCHKFVATTSRSELLGRYPLDGGRAPSLSDWPGEAREGLNFSVK